MQKLASWLLQIPIFNGYWLSTAQVSFLLASLGENSL